MRSNPWTFSASPLVPDGGVTGGGAGVGDGGGGEGDGEGGGEGEGGGGDVVRGAACVERAPPPPPDEVLRIAAEIPPPRSSRAEITSGHRRGRRRPTWIG